MWKLPNLDFEKEEFERTARARDLDKDKLFSAASRGKLVDLDADTWKDLENTDSFKTTSLKSVKRLSKKYGRDYRSILLGIKQKTELPAPVILKKPGQKPYLVAGNTRLMVARAKKLPVKVFQVDLGESETLLDRLGFPSIRESLEKLAHGELVEQGALTPRGGSKNRATTMYKDELVRNIAKQVRFSESDVRKVIDAFVDNVVGAMSGGYSVSLPNFGRFLLKYRSSKQYNHPTLGPQVMPAREIPHFSAAKNLRSHIDANRGRESEFQW